MTRQKLIEQARAQSSEILRRMDESVRTGIPPEPLTDLVQLPEPPKLVNGKPKGAHPKERLRGTALRTKEPGDYADGKLKPAAVEKLTRFPKYVVSILRALEQPQ